MLIDPSSDDADKRKGSTVRVLAKGLHVLRVLNESYEMSALDLSRVTGIPRPTIHRLLNTLIGEGYVVITPANRRYRATERVLALSQGYRSQSRIIDASTPVLAALQKELVWPSDVATYYDGAMVIRATTNSTSPVSVVEERVGSSISVLGSSLGRAYLAFSDAATRQIILDTLAGAGSAETSNESNCQDVNEMLEGVRTAGHAERIGGIVPRTFSFSVPIMLDGRCQAALNIICFPSAIALEKARADLLPRLHSAARAISARLAALM